MVGAWVLTPARRQQRVLAGQASYRALVRRVLLAHQDGEGVIDFDAAAQHLTGCRRLSFRGFRWRRALTGRHMREWAIRLGLCPGLEREAV